MNDFSQLDTRLEYYGTPPVVQQNALLNTLESRLEALAQAIRALRVENQGLKESVSDQGAKIASLTEEKEQLQNKLASLQGEKDQTINRIENLLQRFDEVL
ncbi:MAG: cell division protein ZapB [Magnetococcus sp. DMHC-6]